MSLHCHVCLTIQPASDFKFFLCGHGFCITCIDKILSHNSLCPHCRVRVRRRDAHQVYLDISTLKEQEEMAVGSLVNYLTETDQSSRSCRVEDAARKLKGVSNMCQESGSNVDVLLKALEDFNQRIIPVFKRAEEQHAQIKGLEETREKRELDMQASKRRLKSLEVEVANLRRSIHDTKKERDHAINLAQVASDKTVQLRKDLDLSRDLVSEFEEKNRRYKGQLLGHSVTARKQKERIKALEYDLAHVPAKYTIDGDYVDSHLEVTSQNCLGLNQECPDKLGFTHAAPLSDSLNSFKYGCEYMPPSSFRTNWQLPNAEKVLKKRKRESESLSTDFPLKLDAKGHPIGAVHTGIKRTLRAPVRQVRN